MKLDIKRYAPLPYWLGIVIGFAFALLFTLKYYVAMTHYDEPVNMMRVKRMFLVHTVNFVTWALLLPLLNYWAERYRVLSAGSRTKWIVIGLSIGISFFHEFFSSFLFVFFSPLLELEPPKQGILAYIIRGLPVAVPNRLLEFWVIYAILTAVQMQRQFRNKALELTRLENQLSHARLDALRLQLQPHFLFNTLNTISSLMEINVDAAQKVVSRLGSLLRSVLDIDDRKFIPLEEELEFVSNYLTIEQTRFHDRLSVVYDIDEDTRHIPVPQLILQPLVENAIKHGFSRQTDDGKIEVVARRVNGVLELTIRDDGQGTDRDTNQLLQSGIGLKNVQDRLALLYNGSASMDITTESEQGFAVRIRLPWQESTV